MFQPRERVETGRGPTCQLLEFDLPWQCEKYQQELARDGSIIVFVGKIEGPVWYTI